MLMVQVFVYRVNDQLIEVEIEIVVKIEAVDRHLTHQDQNILDTIREASTTALCTTKSLTIESRSRATCIHSVNNGHFVIHTSNFLVKPNKP